MVNTLVRKSSAVVTGFPIRVNSSKQGKQATRRIFSKSVIRLEWMSRETRPYSFPKPSRLISWFWASDKDLTFPSLVCKSGNWRIRLFDKFKSSNSDKCDRLPIVSIALQLRLRTRSLGIKNVESAFISEILFCARSKDINSRHT